MNTTQDLAQSIGVKAPHRCKSFHKVDSDPQPLSCFGMSREKVRKNFEGFWKKRGLEPKASNW